MRRLWSALRFGLRGVHAAPLVFVASVATMSAGLLLLVGYLLLVANMRSVLSHFGEDLRVVAFLEAGREPSQAEVDQLRSRLAGDPVVEAVRYVSPAAALEQLREDLGTEASVLEALERNPLPGSFEIRLLPSGRVPQALHAAVARFSAEASIDEVRYGEDWVEAYARLLSVVEGVGILLGAFLLVVLAAIVAGTVRLALHAREDEIQIQRLVGADAWFVRLPFYLEGALQGAASAAVALGLLWCFFWLGVPMVRGPLELLLGPKPPVFFDSGQIVLVLGLGVLLGLAGAVLSLVRLRESS